MAALQKPRRTVPSSDLSKMEDDLRDRRIKLNVDYAYTLHYGEMHLLCQVLFLEDILYVAKLHGIKFATIAAYS